MNGHPPKTQISRWETDPVPKSTIHGVENELLVLQKLLGGVTGFRAIGIIGVRGIGKSTVCRALLQDPEVKSKFLPRIWVSMSRDLSKIALLKRILTCLGVEADLPGGQTVGGLLHALRLQLRGKRYLIVLDGVEEEGNGFGDLNSGDLRDGFPRGKGGAVIVTSRSEKAAKAMVGEGNLRRLVPQKDPESFWQIFWQEAVSNGGSIPDPPNLAELKVELLNKCGGLPLAAKMMGQIQNQNRIHQQEQDEEN